MICMVLSIIPFTRHCMKGKRCFQSLKEREHEFLIEVISDMTDGRVVLGKES